MSCLPSNAIPFIEVNNSDLSGRTNLISDPVLKSFTFSPRPGVSTSPLPEIRKMFSTLKRKVGKVVLDKGLYSAYQSISLLFAFRNVESGLTGRLRIIII
jgi:hypothetical protein